ncbi:MAG: multicopper oxidase domain-containing protein [Desulfobulbaceae bacterium]|nr:multicopper oxidase domain-containing protein [Desulfobulbaceae bacterium]
MNSGLRYAFLALWLSGTILAAQAAGAGVLVQCPGDIDGDAAWNSPGEEQPDNTKCMHLSGGDGFITMADGTLQYIFGFSDLTGTPSLGPEGEDRASEVLEEGLLAAAFPAPPIVLDEGDEFYLTLTNVGMLMRPDLFDPHTVHYHGFPEAASIFDGLPESAIAINMGSSLTYYFKVNDPGTFMYHCHAEATEHMQMGMLGNLYVRPRQDGTVINYGGRNYSKFAYNDGDGSTGYDVDYPIQIGSLDSAFHNASVSVQPLPFALMQDDYPVLNGRGYPDTLDPDPLPAPEENGGKPSQLESSLITAAPGDRVLLRISNLNVTRFYTLGTMGVPMLVVGKDAKLLRGPDGKDLYYRTNSVTLGGGESYDVILEIPPTTAPGTRYFLYSTNLNYLSNNMEQFGGMMTEIRIN